MKRFKHLFFLFFIPILGNTNLLFSQEIFKIFIAKGEVYAQRNATWQKIYAGNGLQNSEKIRLGEGAYLALTHTNGSTLELKQSGIFEVSALAKTAASRTSTSGKFANYVLNEAKKTKSSEDDEHRANMSVGGSVERAKAEKTKSDAETAKDIATGKQEEQSAGTDKSEQTVREKITEKAEEKVQSGIFGFLSSAKANDNEPSSPTLTAEIPKSSDIALFPTRIEWRAVENTAKYTVKLSDDAGNLLWERKSSNPYLLLDSGLFALAPEGICLYWTVNVSGAESANPNSYCLRKLSAEQAQQIADTVAHIRADYDEKSALGFFITAGFFEQNSLYWNALSAYRRARELAPDVPEFLEAERDFLRRIAE